ncbi:hypothetical protein ZIOFF_035504 [Zingiber officinale]|uniref:non-specific serine/threonine protein kinase n=1 Tax=Zingiber officinale TaxID=94328 RepID=A0A8J5G9B5_ZINOF|nr:hypothetical protein ZIOFF_035504 [Zingiber officinale]
MGNCCLSPEVVAREDVKTFPRPHHDHDTHPLANKNHLHQNGGGHSKQMATILSGDARAVGGIEEKYVLDRELGCGEFGVTYLCLDHFTGELLACKSISKRRLRTTVDVEDVRREVAIMWHLPRNSSIVSLREACENNGAVHLVMELCEDGELFDCIVARGHYSECAAAVVMKTIVEVVQLCHCHGVIHRDLKPENFLFANKKENSPLKAIDFGLSIFFQPETKQGVAQAILRGVIDFKQEPWPSISDSAKNLVRLMLEPDPKLWLTAKQVLEHHWLQNAKKASNVPLGDVVIADHLSSEEVEDIKEMFKMMDADNDGIVSHDELKTGLAKFGSHLVESEVQMLIEACLYGGAQKGPQLRELDRGADIIVATPGRLNDILNMKRLNLHQFTNLKYSRVEIDEVRAGRLDSHSRAPSRADSMFSRAKWHDHASPPEAIHAMAMPLGIAV